MRKTRSNRGKNPRGLFLPSGSTRWHFQFQYRGQRFTGPTGETDQAKAAQLATAERERIVKQVDAEREASRRPMTVADAFRRYQEGVTLGSPTEATAAREFAWLESLLGSNKSVGELTQSDITDIKSARRTMTTIRGAGRDDQGRQLERLVSASTVNRTLQWLRAALYHVRDHHEAFLRPLKFSLAKEPERVREATPEEEQVLVRHLRNDYHPIFLYGIVSGIRETGLCALEWSRVDFRNRQIAFLTKRHRGDAGLRWETQPLTDLEIKILRSQLGNHPKYVFTYMARGKKGGKGGTGRGGEYVQGKRYPITVENLTTRWERDRAKAAAELPSLADFRWHDLRHTFASRMLRASRSLERVQEAMGHASPAMTRRYAHVLQEDVREAKSEAQKGAATAPELQGFLQGRPNVKVVG
jgi:integrase